MATRLKMLAEQLKISMLERNRLLVLGMKPTEDDENELRQSMKTLASGIRSLKGDHNSAYVSDAYQDELVVLKDLYSELKNLYDDTDELDDFSQDPVTPVHQVKPYTDDPYDVSTSPDNLERSRKSVRFTDLIAERNLDDREVLQMQTQIMQEQDSSLDNLSYSIGRQRELSIHIGNELDEHGELLDDMTGMVDHSATRLDKARSNLTNFSRKARENSHLFTIVMLIILLILLLAIL